MSDHDAADFAERYGPWALVAGASEGVGAAFARGAAERGVNVMLLARRQHVLDEVAASIVAATGVEVRTLAVDLAEDDAMASIATATRDLEVGLLMYCAGADPSYRNFLAEPVGSSAHRTWSPTAGDGQRRAQGGSPVTIPQLDAAAAATVVQRWSGRAATLT